MQHNHSDDLRISELWEYGVTLLPAAGELGFEGIVSKHRKAPYSGGNTDAWIKIKVQG